MQSLLHASDMCATGVQKQLEIASVALNESANNQQPAEAGEQDQGKAVKEEKVLYACIPL